MKLVTVLQSEQTVNSSVSSLDELDLPSVWQREITHIIQENRMLYEPRMETAKDFNELRERLRNRGYTNIPMGAVPILQLQAYKKAPVADTSSCKVKSTMLRKRKDKRG